MLLIKSIFIKAACCVLFISAMSCDEGSIFDQVEAFPEVDRNMTCDRSNEEVICSNPRILSKVKRSSRRAEISFSEFSIKPD